MFLNKGSLESIKSLSFPVRPKRMETIPTIVRVTTMIKVDEAVVLGRVDLMAKDSVTDIIAM